jgi:UDP-glucose 4-epimerase
VTGRPFPVEYAARREGDSPTLVANNDRAKAVLGWAPQYNLSQIIASAWNWHAKSNH